MNLHEYQAKKIFLEYNIPIPKGVVCNKLSHIEKSILELGDNGPWVVKCQIHAGNRGKSGGIKVTKSKKEIYVFLKYWLSRNLVTSQTNEMGQPVHCVLIESYVEILKEFYFGLVVDRNRSCIACIISTKGGVNIETISESDPNLIHKIYLHPIIGPQKYHSRWLGFHLGLNAKQINQFNEIFMSVSSMLIEKDLNLIEINPLVINAVNHNLICLDTKLIADDNALFRHTDLLRLYDNTQDNKIENSAKRFNLNYVPLHGNIGCMINGAGLAMSTMDLIQFYGGKPANFLDIGGNIKEENITEAIKILIFNDQIKVVLINIFGGIVCCNKISISIIKTLTNNKHQIPIIIRLEGNNAEIGIQNLNDNLILNSTSNIVIANSLKDAAKMAVAMSR